MVRNGTYKSDFAHGSVKFKSFGRPFLHFFLDRHQFSKRLDSLFDLRYEQILPHGKPNSADGHIFNESDMIGMRQRQFGKIKQLVIIDTI